MPHIDHRFAFIGGRVPGYVHKRRALAERAMDELRRAEVASAPLLGRDLQRKWAELLLQADEASRVGAIGGDESNAAAQALGEQASAMHLALVELVDKD